MLKKALALTLALILCLGVLAGCGGNQDDPGSSTPSGSGEGKSLWFDEPLKFEIARATTGTQPTWTYIIDLLKETCNVEITFTEINSFGQVYTQMLNDQKLPDVTYLNSIAYGNEYGRKGAYVDISRYLDKMPNLKATLEKYPVYKDLWTNPDDSMFHIPIFTVGGDTKPYTWFYREDVFAAENLTWPSDRAGLEALLRQLKAKYPDSTPLGVRNLHGVMNQLVYMGTQFNAKLAYPGVFGTYVSYDSETGGFYESGTADEMKDMITWIKQMMDENLINKTAFQSSFGRAQWAGMFANNQAFIGFDKLDQMAYVDGEGKKGDANFSLVAAEPIAMNDSAVKAYMNMPSNYSFVVSKKAKRVDDILKFIDWLYSEEGIMLTNWGKEGVDYTMVDGKPQWTAKALEEANPQTSRGLAYAGLHTILDYNAYVGFQTDNIKKSYETVTPWTTMDDYYVMVGDIFLTSEKDFFTSYGAAYTTYINGELGKFLTGNRPLSEWDAFKETASTTYKGAELAQKTTAAYKR